MRGHALRVDPVRQELWSVVKTDFALDLVDLAGRIITSVVESDAGILDPAIRHHLLRTATLAARIAAARLRAERQYLTDLTDVSAALRLAR